MICPQNGTGVLKGFKALRNYASNMVVIATLLVEYVYHREASDILVGTSLEELHDLSSKGLLRKKRTLITPMKIRKSWARRKILLNIAS